MNTTRLKNLFRSDVDDVALPNLWSDDEVATYMDEAQKMFCRLTGGIGDSSSPLCTVDIDASEPFTAIDKRILKIRRIQRDSDSKPLRVVNFEDLDAECVKLDAVEGVVDTVVIGIEPHKLRWVRVPAVADTATMIVYRLPLRSIVSSAVSVLEIDEQHQRSLLLWMEHLAYDKQDADTRDPKKSEEKEIAFRTYCEAATIEMARLRHKPRSVQYGGL